MTQERQEWLRQIALYAHNHTTITISPWDAVAYFSFQHLPANFPYTISEKNNPHFKKGFEDEVKKAIAFLRECDPQLIEGEYQKVMEDRAAAGNYRPHEYCGNVCGDL